MKVQIFNTPQELQAFLTANSLTIAKIASIYFDGASGKHVLVYTP
jgi:hypothetical protein